jgi:hypothetical protein
MFQPKIYVFLVAFACLLTLCLPFCVPSVESKVILPDGNWTEPPPEPGGGSNDGGDPDDIAVNSPMGGTVFEGGTIFHLGDEHGASIWTDEYAVSREEQVVNSRRANAGLLWFLLRLTGQFSLVL